jgi:LDH2 family malate/lactate/ureidoglycolate dehydrogenase
MIGLAMSNSYPKVTAYDGLKPVLGTNPFAFGAPRRNGQSLMLDMATSALAGSTVREHISKGEPLPVGLAIDADGNPITDPKKVGEGALLPFGGAKGYGLALLVEMLAGVITGAGISHGVASMYHDFTESGHNGHFLMALDISRWMSLETYHERLESLIEIIKSSYPGREVLLPGEIRWQHYEDNLANGIRVEHKVRRLLLELSQSHGIMPPWD